MIKSNADNLVDNASAGNVTKSDSFYYDFLRQWKKLHTTSKHKKSKLSNQVSKFDELNPFKSSKLWWHVQCLDLILWCTLGENENLKSVNKVFFDQNFGHNRKWNETNFMDLTIHRYL